MTVPSLRKFSTLAIRHRLLVVIAVVMAIGLATLPGFLDVSTQRAVLDRATVVGLLALGLTPVLLAAHIDLSIGSTMSMAAIATIYFQPVVGNLPAALLGLSVGLAIGAINGALVVVLRISSLVATLATLFIFASLALLLTDSQPLSSADPMFGLGLTRTVLGLFTPKSLIYVAATVIAAIWLRLTPSGRNLYAVGSNPEGATAAGINVNGYVMGVFLLSGLCSGAAGVLQALTTATGSPVAGSTLLIPAITAVVIGGTRLEGGRGSAIATFGGVLALGALTMMLEFNGVPSYTQAIYTGLLLILLITLDRYTGTSDRSIIASAQVKAT